MNVSHTVHKCVQGMKETMIASNGRVLILLQGMALGICPKDKLFRGYIDLEIQLREFDRCRILYQKFLEFGPENCVTWMRVNKVTHKFQQDE